MNAHANFQSVTAVEKAVVPDAPSFGDAEFNLQNQGAFRAVKTNGLGNYTVELLPAYAERLHEITQSLGSSSFRDVWREHVFGGNQLGNLECALFRSPALEQYMPILESMVVSAARIKSEIHLDVSDLIQRLNAADGTDHLYINFLVHSALEGVAYRNGLAIDIQFDKCQYQHEESSAQYTAIVFSVSEMEQKEKFKAVTYNEIQQLTRNTLFPEGMSHPIFAQHYETCYRFSAIFSLLAHPRGHAILDSLLEVHDEKTKSFLVRFPGAGEEVVVSHKDYSPHADHEMGQPKGYVSGGLGIRILGTAYDKLSKVIEEYKNFGFGISDGGYASWTLHYMTGADPFWVSTEGTELVCRPSQYKEMVKEETARLRNEIDLHHGQGYGTVKTFNPGVVEWLQRASGNPDYILTASTGNSFSNAEDEAKYLNGHAYALTRITKEEGDLRFTVVDPRDTYRKTFDIGLEEFSRVFSRISGVRLPPWGST